MNPNQTKLRALLDDVLPASAEQHGPNRAQVLDMLHGERVRRRRRHAGTALVAIVALLLLPLLWKNNHSSSPTAAHVSSTTVAKAARKHARGITIEHVNDDQLLALLHGTPAALVEWPNGDRTLLVIRH